VPGIKRFSHFSVAFRQFVLRDMEIFPSSLNPFRMPAYRTVAGPEIVE